MKFFRILLMAVILFFHMKSNGQTGFKYEILSQSMRVIENNKWSSWEDFSSELPPKAKAIVRPDSIFLLIDKGYKWFVVEGQNSPTVSNSTIYHSSYKCTDQNGMKCNVDLTMKMVSGKEITLVLSYKEVEIKFWLAII